MNIYHEDANPQGIYISYAQRFLQVGKLINASFPVPYLPLINDEESGALKGLLKWVLTTEREIFTASHNPEEYKKLVEMTMAGAEQVRDEMKATGMGYGIVRPGDPSYWLGQLLSHLMKLSRHSADVAFADKILYVTCGMMNLPGPLYVPRAVIDQSPRGKTAEMREYTCFQLLRRIFPCPWADGRLYITAELILFGNNLEQAIWLSARNTQEYLDCLDNTKTHIQGILRAENDELTGRMPEFPITEPFLMHTSDHGEPQEEFA